MRPGTRQARFARLLVTFAVTALSAGLLMSNAALARVSGGPHDFRGPAAGGGNTKYPNLAGLAGPSLCRVCHESHPAAQTESLFAEDFGWKPITRISLPSSGLCMGCHDGFAAFGTGAGDAMTDPGKIIAKKHRRHRVEFAYPAKAGMLKTPGPIVKDAQGRAYVEGSEGPRLPLYVNNGPGGGLKGGCGTCHDPHAGRENRYMLRTRTTKELCPICHSEPILW